MNEANEGRKRKRKSYVLYLSALAWCFFLRGEILFVIFVGFDGLRACLFFLFVRSLVEDQCEEWLCAVMNE